MKPRVPVRERDLQAKTKEMIKEVQHGKRVVVHAANSCVIAALVSKADLQKLERLDE